LGCNPRRRGQGFGFLGLKICAGLPLEVQTVNLDADIARNQRIGLEEVIFILRKIAGF